MVGYVRNTGVTVTLVGITCREAFFIAQEVWLGEIEDYRASIVAYRKHYMFYAIVLYVLTL